jgi:hypothetical protein
VPARFSSSLASTLNHIAGHRRVAGRQRPSQQMRAHLAKMAARPDEVARRLASAARQQPRSIDPANDIKESLRKVMDDLQRVAA